MRTDETVNRSHQWLPMEMLEARQLLSGNVLASVSRGMLTVRGDRVANAIIIDQENLSPEQYRIRSGDGITTVNGQDEVILSAKSINLLMGGGNDAIEVAGCRTVDLFVDTGSGDTELTVSQTIITGELRYQGSGGADTITLEETIACCQARINCREGLATIDISASVFGFGDTIVTNAATPKYSPVKNKGLTIRTGRQDDSVSVVNSFSLGGECLINTGGGNDTISLSRGQSDGLAALVADLVSEVWSPPAGDWFSDVRICSERGRDNIWLDYDRTGTITCVDGGGERDMLTIVQPWSVRPRLRGVETVLNGL